MRRIHALISFNVVASLCLPLHLAWATGAEGIAGSVHDFTRARSIGRDEISNPHLRSGGLDRACGACHGPSDAPQEQRPSLAKPPWGSGLTARVRFESYAEPVNRGSWQLRTGNDAPAGVSKLCLSCHDGVVARNSLLGQSNENGDASNSRSARASASGDSGLAKRHPISVESTDRSANAGQGPSSKPHPRRIECSTCHDVHERGARPGPVAARKSLQVPASMDLAGNDANGDAACVACHSK